MKCVSALSTARTTDAAFHQIVERLAAGLAGETGRPGPGLRLDAPRRRARPDRPPRSLEQGWRGTSWAAPASRSSARTRRSRATPALSLWSIRLPGVDDPSPSASTFDGGRVSDGWRRTRLDDPGRRPSLILLGDPFSFPTDPFLKRLNDEVAAASASSAAWPAAARSPGGNRLVLDGEVYDDGAVGRRARRPGRGPDRRQPGVPADRPHR